MFNSPFPRSIDNNYRSHKITHMVASSADGMPLDTFPPLAAQTVIELFALLGLSRLVLALLCILVVVRYRAMIPFMYLVLLLQHARPHAACCLI